MIGKLLGMVFITAGAFVGAAAVELLGYPHPRKNYPSPPATDTGTEDDAQSNRMTG